MPLVTNLDSSERRHLFKKLEWPLIYTLIALTIISLINLYSATHGASSEEVADLFIKQSSFYLVGWILFFTFTFTGPRWPTRFAYVLYGLNLVAILYVTFFGKVALGAQRWINLGFFSYQPSETMKLALIFILARVLSHLPIDPRGLSFKSLLWPLIIIGLPFILVVEQPDLGTAMLLLLISGTLLLFVGIRTSLLIATITLALVAIPMAWQFVLHDYQKQRVYTFISPGKDPKGSGYNSIQSKIAIGSGQILGKGFQNGTQAKFEFLPERHTDFIFSVLSEEHGFVGSLGVISVFFIIFTLGLRIAATATDKSSALLAVGVLAYLFWHVFINISMVIGLLPIVGVPLPLFSYGGSSLLTTMSALGILSGIAFRRYMF